MTHQLREDITYDAIIVGGGLAGLTTAYMLQIKTSWCWKKKRVLAAACCPNRLTA